MKRGLPIALALLLPMALVSARAEPPDAAGTALVYRSDGTRHCDATPAPSLDATARELTGAGIPVRSQRSAHDGREGIARCGDPTGGIQVFEIAAPDLPRALELGFRRLDPSWIQESRPAGGAP